MVGENSIIAGDVALYNFGGGRINHGEVVLLYLPDTKQIVTSGGNTSAPEDFYIKKGIRYAKTKKGIQPRIEGVFLHYRNLSECIIVRPQIKTIRELRGF